MPLVARIADAIAARLNGQTFDPPFAAIRTYAPILEVGATDGLYVAVTWSHYENNAIAEGIDSGEYTLEVHVRQHLADDTNATADRLTDLVDAIKRSLLGQYLDDPAAGATCTQATTELDPAALYETRQYDAVLTLTYQVIGNEADA